jgi:hypothetical protein
MRQVVALVGMSTVLFSSAPAAGAAAVVPCQEGVVLFLPGDAAEAVRQLEAIQADGYNMVKIASWVWTVPTEGSDLRRTVEAVLQWCDEHGMAVWLLHNIQWGSPGEGGDPEAALGGVTSVARDTLAPWVEVLKGHPCVSGILLGNEVGPGGRELFKDRPRLLGAFREWLGERHGDIATLDARWGTHYASFDEVELPGDEPAAAPAQALDTALPALPPGAVASAVGRAGDIDVMRFCRARFADFYDRIAAEVVKPVLPAVMVGSKGGASPYILDQTPHYGVCSWDDLLANWPLWKIKLLVDTTGLPVFNSELHLYNDQYAFGPSPELSRYRYLTSALLGEWMTASYAWAQWNKPEIAQIHAATPPILRDVARLEPVLRGFNGTSPAFEVLVTESNEEGVEGHPRLELAYAHAAATGLDWRFVADNHLDEVAAPALVVDTPWLTQGTARALAALSAETRLVFVGGVPARDEYGLPLAEAAGALMARAEVIPAWGDLARVVPALPLPAAYTEMVDVGYLWWSPEKGHFRFPVTYPRLEARVASVGGRRYLALINHTTETVSAGVPEALMDGRGLDDLVAGMAVPGGEVTLGPFDVRVYEVK